MKRRGYVVEKIADIDNLREAFVKARRGKAAKKEVVSFSKKLNEELLKLREGILHGTIETGDYNYFTITIRSSGSSARHLSCRGCSITL